MVCGFSVRMTSFSVRHKSQDLLPLENECPLAFIDHSISKGIPLSFKLVGISMKPGMHSCVLFSGITSITGVLF